MKIMRRIAVAIMRTIAPVCERERREFRAMLNEARANAEDLNRTLAVARQREEGREAFARLRGVPHAE